MQPADYVFGQVTNVRIDPREHPPRAQLLLVIFKTLGPQFKPILWRTL